MAEIDKVVSAGARNQRIADYTQFNWDRVVYISSYAHADHFEELAGGQRQLEHSGNDN